MIHKKSWGHDVGIILQNGDRQIYRIPTGYEAKAGAVIVRDMAQCKLTGPETALLLHGVNQIIGVYEPTPTRAERFWSWLFGMEEMKR